MLNWFSNLIAVAIVATATAFAETGFLDRSIQLNGDAFAYQVYVPASYRSTQLWPVIVTPHWNGAQGTDGLLPTTLGIGNQIRLNRDRFPAIVVFPQARPGYRWVHPDMQKLVLAQLEKSIREFRCDPDRIYLVGFSMGGSGALRLAYHWPMKFAAIVDIAGRVVPGTEYSTQERQVDNQTNPYTASADPYSSLAERIKVTPLWIFHGDADRTVPVSDSRLLVQALRTLGANVKYTEYPGVGHGDAATKAFADPQMTDWLFRQHR